MRLAIPGYFLPRLSSKSLIVAPAASTTAWFSVYCRMGVGMLTRMDIGENPRSRVIFSLAIFHKPLMLLARQPSLPTWATLARSAPISRPRVQPQPQKHLAAVGMLLL